MKRTFLVAVLSIATLFGGSIAIILVVTSPPAAPEQHDSFAPSAGAPETLETPVAAPQLQTGEERRPETARAASAPPARRMPTARMADRVTQRAVRKALHASSVESRLASCTRVWEFGGTASAAGQLPRPSPAFLVLALEAVGSELRVVDATVRSWGGASEAAVSCARDVLRSQVIPAPPKRRSDGERTYMHFTLYPRGEAVASR
jgi:hypothetical protein